jgi:hypothetical protein
VCPCMGMASPLYIVLSLEEERSDACFFFLL